MVPLRRGFASARAAAARVAVLYQAEAAPASSPAGAKPMKPGGYRDSGADIAFGLHTTGGTVAAGAWDAVTVVTPTTVPRPEVDLDWVFPDTMAGITAALDAGANALWANTVLHSEHPLCSGALSCADGGSLYMVGQEPHSVDVWEDKHHANTTLRRRGARMAATFMVQTFPFRHHSDEHVQQELALHGLSFPVVVKPCRGRGSAGVSVVHNVKEYRAAVLAIADGDGAVGIEQAWVMVEEFLPGCEVTVAVMPPSTYTVDGERTKRAEYWALPPVERYNHVDSVAPYNGTVAVVHNSRLLSPSSPAQHSAMLELQKQCERVAALVRARAPIRIDARQAGDDASDFVMFDVNLKPNATGPGRPGRDDQDSLVAMAARGIGWDFPHLLLNTLATAKRIA